MTDTTLATWLTIGDAATRIGCSTRTIERLAAAKKLESRLRPQAGSPPVAVYNPDDVAVLAAERQPAAPPFVLDAVQANGNGHRGAHLAHRRDSPFANYDEARAAMVSVVTDLARVLHANASSPLPPVAPTVSETLWVTVQEAAAILGFPQADVRRLIDEGDLNCRRTGRGGIRIRRKDLEAL